MMSISCFIKCVFATKEMTPLHVELYERFFSLHPDDAEKEELLKEQIYHD